MKYRGSVRKICSSLLLGSAVSAFALGGMDGFCIIPTAEVLPHSSYQLFGQLGIHRADAGTFSRMAGVRFGLFDRGELGVELGNRVSLSAKMQFTKDEDWIPAWTIGARQIFNSQEAHFYSVPDSLRSIYSGEVFMAFSKTFAGSTSLHGGVSVIPGLDSGKAGLFWGIHQPFGKSLGLVYDGFYRSGWHHHNLGLDFNFRKTFRMSFGATEIMRAFYQNNRFGFFTSDRENRSPDAYSTPGIWVMVSFTGFMQQAPKANTQERLDVIEKRQGTQTRRTESTEARLDRLELQIQELRKGGNDSLGLAEARAEQILDNLVQGLQNDAWDPRTSRRQQDSLLAIGEVAKRLLMRTAQRESSAPSFRIAAIRLMATDPDPRYFEILSTLLTGTDVTLSRESALALAKIGTPQATAILKSQKSHCLPEIQKLLEELSAPAQTATAATPTPAAPSVPPVPPPPANAPADTAKVKAP